MIDLPLLHVTLHLHQLDDLRLPEHAGSMLRGAFGHALRKLACITKQKDCSICPLYRSCAYTQIFETPAPLHEESQKQQSANPYVIHAPNLSTRLITRDSTWQFGLVLIGKAIDQLPLIAYAWQKACEHGFGTQQSKARLVGIYQDENSLYQPDKPLKTPQRFVPDNTPLPATIRLHFTSPVRIQHQNHVILRAEELTASVVLITLAKRIQRLAELHAQPVSLDIAKLVKLAQTIRLDSQLTHATVTRYSNRQQRLMNLEGLMGEITLTGELGEFAPLLRLGEQVHVGKSATFGLGRYTLTTSRD